MYLLWILLPLSKWINWGSDIEAYTLAVCVVPLCNLGGPKEQPCFLFLCSLLFFMPLIPVRGLSITRESPMICREMSWKFVSRRWGQTSWEENEWFFLSKTVIHGCVPECQRQVRQAVLSLCGRARNYTCLGLPCSCEIAPHCEASGCKWEQM